MGSEQHLSHAGRVLMDTEEVPGGIIVYYADGDEEIIHVNSYILGLFECDTEEEFMELTHGSFRGFVHAEDIDSAENSIWGQVDARGGFDHIFYQIRTKSGRLVAVDDYGRLIKREGSRPVFHVFVVEMDRDGVVDWLTGLPGTTRFRELAGMQAHAMRERGQRPVAAVFDLIGMKGYNRRYGREQGDELLRAFAGVLRSRFGGEACSRFAEDRFYVLADERGAREGIEAALADFAALEGSESLPSVLPVRAGAYVCDPGDDVIDLAFERARMACDLDRKTWKSHVTWFSDQMRAEARQRLHVLDSLRRALDEGWVVAYYQPIVRSSTGMVCGEEALARWHDPWRGMLAPDQFIPVLEEAGLLHELDMHMIDCVVADLARRRRQGIDLVPVSINISLRDLREHLLAEELSRRADAAGIPHELLKVEFTESAELFDTELLSEQIAALHRAGFSVWMDDFGSGYSSLNSLQEYEFDLIKLDMGFLHTKQFGTPRSIVADIVRTGKRLGMRTLAEGVESEEQAAFLEAIGCDMLQGFHYAKPRPLDEDYVRHLVPREPLAESAYWDAVCSFDLGLRMGSGGGGEVVTWLVDELPAGVVELRDDVWRTLRANGSLRDFFRTIGLIPDERVAFGGIPFARATDESFSDAVERSERSGTWELVDCPQVYGSDFLYYVRPLASVGDVRAYAITSTPSTLGSSLGPYGDVPVAYAVFHVTLNDAGDGVLDTEYVYANEQYRDWLGYGQMDPTGRSFLETVGNASTLWFPYCFRAVVHGETSHDMVYSPEIGHWLSFSVAPCPVEGCCVFAFTKADREHRERELLRAGRETSDLIIRITDSLNGDLDYEQAMNGLLETMSSVIHPERLYIFERWEHTSSNTFEWCAPGIEPEIGILQDLDNAEFAVWDQMLESGSVVIIPDVSAYKGVNDRLYELLHQQGVTRLLAVPFYGDGKLIGYLGADNYALDERLDTHRLLETVASFIAARMTNRRLMDELERLSSYDPLTDLLNRRGIDAEIERRLEEEPGKPFALALLDIDDFKSVNDSYGHDVGDETLRSLARTLERVLPEGAVIGRNGGDEMLVALFDTNAEQVEATLARMTSAGSLSCELGGRRYPYSVSVGCTWCTGADDLMSAYSRADSALYEVKRNGKSGCRFAS